MNTTTTNWHYQQARRAIDGTGLTMIGNTGQTVATKVVSNPNRSDTSGSAPPSSTTTRRCC
jgi:hypothetical protein